MEAALMVWIGMAIASAFLLSHTAYRHGKREFRWFLCGLTLGVFSIFLLGYLRRSSREVDNMPAWDATFEQTKISSATGVLDA